VFHVRNHYPILKNLYYPSNRVHCDNCEKDITKHVRVQCIDCPAQCDICVNCFLGLVVFDQHVPEHRYQLVNKLNFPLFVEDWTAEEELLLMEGLERKGFGNWQDIAEMIGNEKTREEIERHYDEVYLGAPFRNVTPKPLS
jgi:transcriptional adapter 2-alpha